MLGLAAQWAGLSDGLHAHSTAPLLVSDEQGLGKSTFCRALLPPQLQAYYTDSVDLARPDKVERQLTEMGLLNLDEFDRIPEKKHPLLKNLMQLSALNLRKAYQRHSQALPRIASFIGTSNSRELLSDPSGSRRFICVLVKHPIDSTGIDHAQIYAQLKAELENGERYWQPRGRERPAVAQCGFLPHLPGRGGITPLLSCGSTGGEGTVAFAARNIRTATAAGTRSDGRHNAAQAGSSPRSRRSTESTHALRKPIQGGGKVIVGI
jgi:Predicted P-loop ATPase and inactivated derivatives